MAVEIKEIVIRATLTEEDKSTKSPDAPLQDTDALIRECVHQVMKILKKKNLR